MAKETMQAFDPQRCRILVIAAHPDDETIGCGALLSRASDAFIAYLTDGVPNDAALRPAPFRDDSDAYRRTRKEEAESALSLVGINEDRVIRLEGVDQESSYGMVPLVDRLLLALEEIRPDIMITHPYEGGHPDHDTAAFVTRAACTVRAKQHAFTPSIWEMTSYHGREGRLVTGSFLDDPNAAGDGPSLTLALSSCERRCKELMLECFTTQKAVLASFGVDAERFRLAPRYDFSLPPHRGALYYEGLGWPLSGNEWRELARRADRHIAGSS